MLSTKPKHPRVAVFARAVILVMLVVCALALGPRASAQESDDAEALNAEVERLFDADRYDEAIPLGGSLLDRILGYRTLPETQLQLPILPLQFRLTAKRRTL